MSGSAIADRLRSYVKERRAALVDVTLAGSLEDWAAYQAATARIDELDGMADQITEIMKDINGGV